MADFGPEAKRLLVWKEEPCTGLGKPEVKIHGLLESISW
jgi:hypothetical protein